MPYDKQRHTAGDVVPADQAFEAIGQMLWRERLRDRDVAYVVEGSNSLRSPSDAQAWIKESANLGFTEVRFLIASDDGRTLVIELSASSPLEESEEE
jgi:hypothetical protein